MAQEIQNLKSISDKYIQKGKYSWRIDTIDTPSIVILGKGRKYSIQYGGCACYHAIIQGTKFELPLDSFNNRATIFNRDLWYRHTFSLHAFEEKKSDFLLETIEREICNRCTKFASLDEQRLSGDIFGKQWITPYQHVRLIKDDSNQEAFILCEMIYKNKLRYGILTWENCD